MSVARDTTHNGGQTGTKSGAEVNHGYRGQSIWSRETTSQLRPQARPLAPTREAEPWDELVERRGRAGLGGWITWPRFVLGGNDFEVLLPARLSAQLDLVALSEETSKLGLS